VHVAGEEHIGYDASSGEQFDILKSPADAAFRYFMGVKAGNRFAIEDDLSDLGTIVAGHAVQQARLSRAVRSDNGQQLARFDVQIDILEGNQPARDPLPQAQPDGRRAELRQRWSVDLERPSFL
jgi:hypothetical protein